MTARPVPVVPDALTVPRRDGAPARPNLIGMTREEMRAALIEAGTPERQAKMRVGQVWQWLYHKGVREFAAMTNLAKPFRAMLDERFEIALPEVVRREGVDRRDAQVPRPARGAGTRWRTVYIPEEGRGTLCVSSQVGCTLTCSFCHTGTQKLVRNLTAGEIVGQLMLARDDLGEWPEPGRTPKDETRLLSNIVLMGMGEPLYNFAGGARRDADRHGRGGDRAGAAADHAVHLRGGARDRALRDRDRVPARGELPRDDRRGARRAGADQQAVEHRGPPRCAARAYPKVSQFRADHLRIRDARRGERFATTTRGG